MSQSMTKLKMRISPATNDQWDRVWESCEYATYFHSRQWADLWREYTRGEMTPEPQLVEFPSGKQAILPATYKSRIRGLVRECHLSPGSSYGGWLASEQLDEAEAKQLADHITSTQSNLIWRLNPYDPALAALDLHTDIAEQTQAIRLNGDLDAVFRGLTRGHRSSMKKAQREGVYISQADSPDKWRTYYEIYLDSIRRWGEKTSMSYSWSMFDVLQHKPSTEVILWIASYEGQIIAGAICFSARNHVVYWHGAALESHFALRPVNLLMYEIIRDTCKQGKTWFDFNPSGQHEGVSRFKKGFGAVSLPCPLIHQQSAILRTWKTIRGTRGSTNQRVARLRAA